MKKLYIIRHGETEYNRKGMVQGSGIDSPLNETGERQADAFYEAYKNVPFQKVYTSNLIRTQQTVQKFIDRGIPSEALTDLREISWGMQEGVAFTPETSTVYQQICEAWTAGDLEAKIDGGETPLEVASRQQKAIDHILSQSEELVLICIHGRAMRIMMCWMTGRPLYEMDRFEHTNTGLYVVNYEDGTFAIEVSNETSHLEPVKS